MMRTSERTRPIPLLKETTAAAWLVLAAWLTLGSTSPASTITGTVMNLTRNTPSAGDDVVLYRVDKSMHEVARAKTDARGTFRFQGPNGSPYLVSAIHERISYHTPLLRQAGSATVFVYDAVPRLAAVHESSITLFPARESQSLTITQFFVVSNASIPARTLNTPFSFRIPARATLDSTAVEPPGTLPFLARVSTCGGRDQYCIESPLRPGDTRIRVIYHFDFSAGVSVVLPLPPSVNQVLVKVPASLHLRAKAHTALRNQAQKDGLSIYSVEGLPRTRTLSFSLSPAAPATIGANAEKTPSQPAFDPRDADYEMRTAHRSTAARTAVSSPTGESTLPLIVLLSGLLGTLAGAGVVVARLSRTRIPEMSLSRKAQ